MKSAPCLARSKQLFTWGLLSFVVLTQGCQKSKEEAGQTRRDLGQVEMSVAAESELGRLIENYADIAHAVYADSAAGARALQKSLQELATEPSTARLEAAKQAYIAARKPYLQSELLRFYGGPIDAREMWINSWPIDENYVEAAGTGAPPGILEDSTRYPEITPSLLESLNTKAGETSVSTGYHVIEFLLWGRDTRSDGPGARPVTDYQASTRLAKSDAASLAEEALARRRVSYLTASVELLARDLETVRDAWAQGVPGNYRQSFLALKKREALALVIKGMGALSGPELAGERLTVAYATKDQENEHSCFSDTTHLDLLFDVQGLVNACEGGYTKSDGTRVSGLGLCAFVKSHAPELGARLERAFQSSLAAARAIPAPFDQAILGADSAPGRKAVQSLIAALERQAEELSEVARAFDLRVSLANADPGQ